MGVTRTDLVSTFALPAFRDALLALGHRIPVMRVDARNATQVDFLIRTLLSCRYAETLDTTH